MTLHPDRLFSPDPTHRKASRELYETVKALPLVCPHGHVDPRIFANPDYRFRSPTELLITPDHYVFRMLYSQGISLESLGIPSLSETALSETALSEAGNLNGTSDIDPRDVWQIFADNFHLFLGTPTGIWLRDEFENVFGISEKLASSNAQDFYTAIEKSLHSPSFAPRALYERFNIEVLCTTDAATDELENHRAIKESGWAGRILPTFRPDSVIKIGAPGWLTQVERLGEVTGVSIVDYKAFLQALGIRRTYFKSMGAKATDHDAPSAYTTSLSPSDASAIFNRALKQNLDIGDGERFMGHMLVEMARMSTEDGLVMQLHTGSFRNHNASIYQQFGSDKGADIPTNNEFTRNLKPLLDAFGNHPQFRLILFTLDESTYSRELAPLAGHYPSIRLGPPWWFHDSLNGIKRYFDQVMETAGIFNTVGFNDDTRAFPSIPARHDVWRRVACDWVAGLLVRHIIDEQEAQLMVHALAYDLAKSAYNLE